MLLGKQALGGWLFDNYQVTSILSDAGTSVVYSVTTINNERFIIKVALPSKINQLENEFWISKRLINNHFVPQPLEMRSSESLAAIFWKEEINYISLDQYLSTTHRIPPNEFLTIAEQIAEAVHLVHSAGIIHRDLSSANFLIEPVTKSIKLIGFTNSVFWKESVSSSFYSSEPPYCGTYQFISPEHTGKLQTVVDFRSDLYSIGMVFHQMLLGHTPFEPIKNLTSLIYAHTAVQIPLIDHYQEIDIPIVLGHIVAKLLEKDTRRRYQSSLGLQADLKQAATFLEKTLPKDFRTLSIVRFKQQIPSSNSQAQLEYLRTMSRHAAQTFEQAGNCPMKLGNFDKCSVLRQAHTIFGREEELSNILNIWKNTLNKSAAVFIKGNSGLGKSSLATQSMKLMCQTSLSEEATNSFLLAEGKFLQFDKTPYNGIVRLLQNILHTTIKDHTIEKVTAVVQQFSSIELWILSQFVSGIGSILGDRLKIETPDHSETFSRIVPTICSFLKNMGDLYPSKRVVLLLDDLQRADMNSITLIKEALIASQEIFGFFTYRENEEDISAIEDLQRALSTANVHQLTLSLCPLNEKSIQEIIIEMIGSSSTIVEPLAILIKQKTKGNPFFVRQFINKLYEDTLLKFDFVTQDWTVDLEECKQLSHTSNVIEILLDGIFKLPGSTIDVLKTASCIGSTFELKTLSTILSSTERDIRKLLQQGLRQGFIQPSSKNANVTHSTDEKTISLSSASSFDSHYFQFVHDRIHEGFYKFVTETEKPALHLAIGQLLLQAFPDAETPTELFTLVQHLNIGRSLISQADSLVKLANLNLKASSLVLIGRGYSKAIYYAETALELLGRISEDIWQSFYSQSISLYTNLALAKGLNGQIAESKHDFELAYSYAKETLDRVVLLKDRAGIEVGILNYSEAVKLILEALQLCQVKFEISFPSFFVHLAELKGIMKGRTFVEIFKSVPVSDDKISRMIYLLLVYLIPPSFASRNIELCLLIPVISLLHSIKFGVTPGGTSMISMLQYVETATGGPTLENATYGKQAAQLTEPFGIPVSTFNAYCNWAMVSCFSTTSQREMICVWQKTLSTAFEINSSFDVIHGYFFSMFSYYDHGVPLGDLYKHYLRFVQYAVRQGNLFFLMPLQGLANLIQVLMYNRISLIENLPRFSDETLAKQLIYPPMTTYIFYTCKLLYLMGCDDRTLEESLTQLSRVIVECPGLIPFYEYKFYYPLMLIHLRKTSPDDLEKIQECLSCLKTYSKINPQNFRHKYLLIKAELLKVSQSQVNFTKISNLYEEAISSAFENHFYYVVGLAGEQALKFYLSRHVRFGSARFLETACLGYTAWQANAKVELLLAQYASKLQFGFSRIKNSSSAFQSPSNAMLQVAKQVLSSGESYRDKLLFIIELIVQHTGADRGMFYYFSKSRDSIYLLADWNPGARGRVFPLPEEYELFLDSNPQHEQPVLCSLSKQNSILSLVNQFVRGIINAEQLQTSIQLTDRSVHCEPLIYMNEMIGLLYLENSLITSGFPDKSQMLFKLLSNHISVCCGRELLDLQLRQTIKHLHSTHQKLLHLTSIKQQFIHNASSELKLPLNCILDLVALVKENETLEGDKSGLIEMMENSARGLLSIINDILDVKRDHFDVSISAFDLRARLDELVRLSSVNLDPELSLLLDFQFVGSVYLQGDPLLVEHLLLKLLMNAIKFTKKGAIVLRVRLADGISNSSLNNQNVALQFEVTDPGIGISAEQLSNLFSEFTQIQSGATRAYSGTGLGLSVAKKILRTLSGNDASFQVTSKVGVGSTFSFTIPFQCVRIEQTLPREYQVLNGYGVVVYTPSDEVYCSYQGNLLGMQSKFVTQARNFTELAALLTQSDVANTFYCIDVENWEQASNFPLWSEVSRLSKVDECFRPMIIISSKINSLGIKSELFTLLEQMACNYNFLTRPFKQLSLISAMFTTLTKNVTPV